MKYQAVSYDEAIKWFAGRMVETMRNNSHKSGWNTLSAKWCLNRLIQETKELRAAIEQGESEAIIGEATDVANFAMMIAHSVKTPTTGGR